MGKPHPCYYCEGTGVGEERIDVDAYRDIECPECSGSGIAHRTAGDRYTGPKPITYGLFFPVSGDPLEILAKARRAKFGGPPTPANYDKVKALAMGPVKLPRLEPKLHPLFDNLFCSLGLGGKHAGV